MIVEGELVCSTYKLAVRYPRNITGHDTEDTAIVHAVIAFAKALNLSIIAEGIETAEQLAHLVSLNCDLGQGYYFSKPLPAELIRPLFTNTFNVETEKEKAYAL